MQLKSIPATDFKLDGETGIFEGYASTFGNRDAGGDIVMPGAFDRTIKERLPQKLIKVYRNHTDSAGMPLEMREDGRGLWVRAQLNMDKQVGRETYAELKSGELAHMSFAYNVVRDELDHETNTRKLHELTLYEFGPVAWPMNDQARVSAVKAIRESLGTSPTALTLPDAMAAMKSVVLALEAKGELSTEEREWIKSAKADIGVHLRTLSALPRTREVPPAAAPEDPEQTKVALAALDFSGVMAALHNLRSVASPPGA
jgi:hypothetical protein